MKNLHLIPTNKPSRLCKTDKLRLYPNGLTPKSQGLCKNQNICITNDEEIKEGEIGYIIDKQNNIRKVERVQTKNIGTPSYYCNSHSCDSSVSNVCYSIPIEDCKKIILTTDEDLIKDCVQAIDDEFLEWFVKNPSCEEVDVEEEDYSQKCRECGETVKRGYNCNRGCFMKSGNFILTDKNIKYKIILPIEEPKQRLEKYSERFDNDKSPIGNPETWGKRMVEEPKQETLEEAAEKLILEYELGNTGKIDTEDAKEMLIEFAKWQAERMISKEAYEDSINMQKCSNAGYESKIKELQSEIERMYNREDMKNAFDSAREFNSLEGVVDVHIVLPMGGDMSDLQPLHFTFEEWFEQFKKK